MGGKRFQSYFFMCVKAFDITFFSQVEAAGCRRYVADMAWTYMLQDIGQIKFYSPITTIHHSSNIVCTRGKCVELRVGSCFEKGIGGERGVCDEVETTCSIVFFEKKGVCVWGGYPSVILLFGILAVRFKKNQASNDKTTLLLHSCSFQRQCPQAARHLVCFLRN